MGAPPSVATHFAPSYAEAREKFLAAARARDLAMESHVLTDRKGIDGETLATDVALAGAPDATGLLMITSATHGVEGHCGSGCQVALLRDDDFMEAVATAGVAVLFVHAVNPYGFSHGRRVNEDNVDLNRNFRDFATPAPANAAYAEIHPLLIPAAWPPPAENEARIAALIAQRGVQAWQAALTGGQYTIPDGMFYGGAGPTWSNRTLRDLLRRHGARRKALGWIDIHTGLGPSGHGEKIYSGPPEAGQLARVRDWWGPEVTSFHDGTSTSARLTGLVTDAVPDECPGVEWAAIALEFGTVPLMEVLQTLRADHWRHLHGDAPVDLRAALRRQTRDAFYVDADDWKERVGAQARSAALAAVARLARG
jgi:hypothetical protein